MDFPFGTGASVAALAARVFWGAAGFRRLGKSVPGAGNVSPIQTFHAVGTVEIVAVAATGIGGGEVCRAGDFNGGGVAVAATTDCVVVPNVPPQAPQKLASGARAAPQFGQKRDEGAGFMSL